ncbi:MAG: glycosyl transferase group 1 [Acidobacteriaceae bacterium]|nr:glycosyl transferase group 1 [Acidobacteriaceae bacterium]
MQGHQLNVTMLVSGFPCDGKPKNGIFNLRAVKALREFVNITVIHLRTWLPDRPTAQISEVEGIPVTTIAVPQSPWGMSINVALYQYLGWPQVRSLVQNCDIVHSVGTLAGVLASTWARRTRTHHVFQATGSDINAFLPRMRAARSVAGWENHLHAVACNSEALAAAFLALYPGFRNVRTVWRGVDLDSFHPSGPVAGPLADKPPVRYTFLGGFGLVAPQLSPLWFDVSVERCRNRALPFGANTKGGETLLQAWQGAEDELVSRGASLLVLGCEPPYYDRIRRWQAGLRYPERVHLGSSIRPEMVSAYIRASDAVLVPSLQEGLPNVAVEASACGRPVIASNVGGLSEVVVNGETGVLLPAGDVAAWKNVLVSYADRLSCLQTMGKRARQRTEALFDSRNYPVRMLELYEAALGELLPN